MSGILAPNFDAIPADMRSRAQWVCWRQEPNDKPDGKPHKVPYIPGTSYKASSTDHATWRSFDVARRAYLTGAYDGISYAVGAGDGQVFVDVDHCVDGAGSLTPRAQTLVEELGTYAEYSPGDGLHLFARGTLAGDWHRRGDVEIYWEGRFATITGHHVPGTPDAPMPVTAALEQLYAGLAPPQPVHAAKFTDWQLEHSYLSDAEVLAKAGAARNGLKFTELYAGDVFGYEGDESAADLALCGMLAYWCGNETSQMDRLFRRSGLMRPKWDTRRGAGTYGSQTLARARAATVYSPQSVKSDGRADEAAADGGTRERAGPQSVKLSDRALLRKLALLEAENTALKEQAAQKDARIAEIATRLEFAEGVLDRVEAEAPYATIERLDQRVARLEQEKREILALARDTALKPVARITGIVFKEAGRAYRQPLAMGREPEPVQEARVHVAELEKEIDLPVGTSARHIKEVVARGHFNYRIAVDTTRTETGPPRSVAFISPGDGMLRSVVSLRLVKAKTRAEKARTDRDAREAHNQARIAELEAALARTNQDGCTLCGGPLLPTGYHCPACRVEHTTHDLAAIGNMRPPALTRPGPRDLRTKLSHNMSVLTGRAPPDDAWLGEGRADAF